MAKEWDDLTEKEQLLCYISDCFKDAYGCRPRGIYNDYSVEELRSTLDSLYVFYLLRLLSKSFLVVQAYPKIF